MIIDNANDEYVFTNGTNPRFSTLKTLESFIPQSSQGSLLVTSRNYSLATILVGSYHNMVAVEPMTDEEALVLLKSIAKFSPRWWRKIEDDEEEEEEAKKLVEVLNCIPLAVVQAASFIGKKEPKVTITDYLKLFEKEGQSIVERVLQNPVYITRRLESQ